MLTKYQFYLMTTTLLSFGDSDVIKNATFINSVMPFGHWNSGWALNDNVNPKFKVTSTLWST